MQHVTVQREDDKSSFPRYTAYRELFVAILFTNEYGHWREKSYLLIVKKTMPTIQGHLQFEHVALLLAMY